MMADSDVSRSRKSQHELSYSGGRPLRKLSNLKDETLQNVEGESTNRFNEKSNSSKCEGVRKVTKELYGMTLNANKSSEQKNVAISKKSKNPGSVVCCEKRKTFHTESFQCFNKSGKKMSSPQKQTKKANFRSTNVLDFAKEDGKTFVDRRSVDKLSEHGKSTATSSNREERNWRDRDRQNSNYGNQNSWERFFRKQVSRRNSFCNNPSSPERQFRRYESQKYFSFDNRNGQNSPDRNPRMPELKMNSFCENRSKQSNFDGKEQRSWGGNMTKLTEETNLHLRQQLFDKKNESKQPGIIALPRPTLYVPKYTAPIHVKMFLPRSPSKPHPLSSTKTSVPANDPIPSQEPVWYDPNKENFHQSCNPKIIRDIIHADCELQFLFNIGEMIMSYWERLQQLRYDLKERLKIMLMTDLRFCQAENVEQHLWKILYYNIIELLRKFIRNNSQWKEKYKTILLNIIEEGSGFYESLLNALETNNKIKMREYLNTPCFVREGVGHLELPLAAAQKIYLCLGDLALYKEQVKDTSNYGAAFEWYTKAYQINPRNGRPYNQLAILAMCDKRRLDALYYYMRSLMSSNPVHSVKDSLSSLFDDYRKKYENVDRKRKEVKAEICIQPKAGKNMQKTISTCQLDTHSADEELYTATSIDLNRRFCRSYIGIHGKFFTKIGLENLSETIQKMLREFRVLLHRSPIPLISTRFLWLFALNMFAIEITQPGNGTENRADMCYSYGLQETALAASHEMLNLLLERFNKTLQEHLSKSILVSTSIPADCEIILPAVKIWCDWLTLHTEIWKPPTSCRVYKVGPPADCWTRLAILITLLEKLNFPKDLLHEHKDEDSELVYLPEDVTLDGFAPLMSSLQVPVYVHKSIDTTFARHCLRVQKILFFGSVFLCGLDPPVLKLQKSHNGESEYISVVDTPGSQDKGTQQVRD